ncbi:MAG: cytochrome c [Chloroflexi bacterium]|nr:cytochrome c [Chloroflexota bacterium]
MRHLVFALLIPIALGGCSGLSGEPDIVATMARPRATTAPIISDWRPDVDNGARIFAERCTDCHGENGDGLGALVLSGSVERPPDITDRAAVSLKSPLEWYEIITKGKIENLMPPWENALSEAERWDVALYSYSLSYDDTLLETGKGLWSEKCGECEIPALIPPVFSDAEYGARLNAEHFEGALSPEEIGAVVAFLRMRSLESSGASTGGAPGEMAGVPRGSIAGRVAHGTAGGLVPADTILQLQYGNPELGFNLAETTLDADLSFVFEDIPMTEALRYVVSVVYQGRLFSRQLPAGRAEDLTITLYDVTDNPAVLSVSRIDLFVDAIELADLGKGLYISQIIGFQNKSDRIFTSGRGFDDGREAVLLMQFPLGSGVMSGTENGRYVVIEDMENIPDSIIDTLPVPPGDSHQVILEYFLPYDGVAQIEQPFNYRIDADLSVTLAKGLAVESDLTQLEEDSEAGEGIPVYSGRLRLDSEPRLSLSISGDPFSRRGGDQLIVTQENLVPVLAGIGVIAFALLAGFGYRRRRRDSSASEIDSLVAELARLEDDHDQGRINHDLYHHKRRELKARLAELMADSD